MKHGKIKTIQYLKNRKEYRLMRLGKYLSSLTKPELEELEKFLNLTDDECIIFHLLSKNKSIIEISDKVGMSRRTTDRRINDVKRKVEKIHGNY